MTTQLVYFGLVFLLLGINGISGQRTRVVFNSFLSGPCRETFEQGIEFDRDRIYLDPPNPELPGSFRINVDVKVTKVLRYVAAELELRLGDWNADPLPCQEKQPDGCGGQGSCSYCNFCNHFTQLNADVQILDFPTPGSGAVIQQTCPIVPSSYRISASIDLNDNNFINDHMPVDILDELGPNREIPLYTTLWIYDTRYQDLNPYLNATMRARLFDIRKKDWVVGCYRIVSLLQHSEF